MYTRPLGPNSFCFHVIYFISLIFSIKPTIFILDILICILNSFPKLLLALLQDVVELVDQPYDKMAKTITPPKMTDASTQLQGILSDLYSASNSSTQTPKY